MLLIVAHHYVANSGPMDVMVEDPLSERFIFFYVSILIVMSRNRRIVHAFAYDNRSYNLYEKKFVASHQFMKVEHEDGSCLSQYHQHGEDAGVVGMRVS